MQKPIRIAGVQGFYGDSPAGALAIAKAGAADYLMHDALAELTLSILQKDRSRDAEQGFAKDILFLSKTLYPICFKKGIRIVTSSGGLNPVAAGKKVAEILTDQGVTGVKIAVITGDDVSIRIKDLQQAGEGLNHLDSGVPFDPEGKQLTHANVYVGASCIAEALDQGANLILAGRVADPCLTLGILLHEYKWKLEGVLSEEDLNRLAAGITAGHVIECGGQASGGNSYAEWPPSYRMSNLGYPIAHVYEDGRTVFTRLQTQGGTVTRDTIREQLVYEIHDPAQYITPDVTVDLTRISLREIGPDQVELTGAIGNPRPEKLKLAMGVLEGFLSDQFFFFSWPYAYEKCQKFIDSAKEIMAGFPVKVDRQEYSILGVNGIHGAAAPAPSPEFLSEVNELGVRVCFFHKDPKAGKVALQSLIALALNGPPGLISVPGWGNRARAQLSLWPALIDRKHIQMNVEMIEV